MKRTSRDDFSKEDFSNNADLLGYVLGALEEHEAQQVEDCILREPGLEDDLHALQSDIAPLAELTEVPAPPAGLARRTCEAIAAHRAADELIGQDTPTSAKTIGVRMSDSKWTERLVSPRSWSRWDFLAAAAAILVLAAVVVPVVQSNRFHARITNCQDNLRIAGLALMSYADHHGGDFIGIPRSGNLAFAGSYAPTLLEEGLVDNDRIFFCSGRGNVDKIQRIPSFQRLQAASGAELIELQRQAGGDYGYNIGYIDDGRYVSPRHLGRANFVLLADSPSADRPGRGSLNHGGAGQNCLFEDGHYEFVKVNSIGSDAIYENDLGQIAPGAHEQDIVIAPSYVRLFGQ